MRPLQPRLMRLPGRPPMSEGRSPERLRNAAAAAAIDAPGEKASEPAPLGGMRGRQIRWGSVGRAAAIAAAAIAGIVSLPAVLGSDKPPPVPADVGLAPQPQARVPVAGPAEPALPNPASKAHPGGSGEFFRHIRNNSPKGRRLGRKAPNRRRSSKVSHPRAEHAPPTPPPPSSPVPASPPVYSYVPPASSGEFRFER
jgi:hypothetical protein